MLTNSPHTIAATTATIDLLIPVSNRKEITTESRSVKKKFLRKNFFIKSGKCVNEITKLIQVKKPNNMPSYIFPLVILKYDGFQSIEM